MHERYALDRLLTLILWFPFASWNHLLCVNCPMFGDVRQVLNDITILHNI